MQDGLYRVDVVSDTHGTLTEELLEQLKGADLIVHAGDFCSPRDYRTLCGIARLEACRGNNDYEEYDPPLKRVASFKYQGLWWQLCHYEERLDLVTCDIAVCGHSHRPFVRQEGSKWVINPGSPTFPRSGEGPTMARMLIEPPADPQAKGKVVSAEVIRLRPDEEPYSPWARFFRR